MTGLSGAPKVHGQVVRLWALSIHATCSEVIANIPTYFDKGTSENVENYSLDDTGKTVLVDFTYQQGSSSKLLQQRAEAGTQDFRALCWSGLG